MFTSLVVDINSVFAKLLLIERDSKYSVDILYVALQRLTARITKYSIEINNT